MCQRAVRAERDLQVCRESFERESRLHLIYDEPRPLVQFIESNDFDISE